MSRFFTPNFRGAKQTILNSGLLQFEHRANCLPSSNERGINPQPTHRSISLNSAISFVFELLSVLSEFLTNELSGFSSLSGIHATEVAGGNKW